MKTSHQLGLLLRRKPVHSPEPLLIPKPSLLRLSLGLMFSAYARTLLEHRQLEFFTQHKPCLLDACLAQEIGIGRVEERRSATDKLTRILGHSDLGLFHLFAFS